MQHLNYCRQYRTHMLAQPQQTSRDERDIALLSASVKFLLPDGGFLLRDEEYRAIVDEEVISLPFPVIALEFHDEEEDARYMERKAYDSPYKRLSSKHILLAAEFGDFIKIWSIAGIGGTWMSHDTGMAFPKRQPFWIQDGALMVSFFEHDIDINDENAGIDSWPLGRFGRGTLDVLLSFLNALACSNVNIARSDSKKSYKTKRAALPFDDYHLLTIEVPGRAQDGGLGRGGSHRSPREHLRRGHIRRLQDGRKLWVNATVVNPGVGGKVSKDYALRAAA